MFALPMSPCVENLMPSLVTEMTTVSPMLVRSLQQGNLSLCWVLQHASRALACIIQMKLAAYPLLVSCFWVSTTAAGKLYTGRCPGQLHNTKPQLMGTHQQLHMLTPQAGSHFMMRANSPAGILTVAA